MSRRVYLVQENGHRRRVAIYCRVSTSDQDNERQERDVTAYAGRAGFEVVGVFRETLSGIRKAKGKQPLEREKVLALAQAREIDAVLVTELTRWGRSTQDLIDTLGQLLLALITPSPRRAITLNASSAYPVSAAATGPRPACRYGLQLTS